MEKDLNDITQVVDADQLTPVEFVSANRNLLESLPLCEGIAFQMLEPFFNKCNCLRLAPGDLLLSPGQINHHLYLLLSGQLIVYFNTVGTPVGIPVAPGELVGEVSIIDGLAPMAYVAASRESLVLSIHESLIWLDLFQIPGAARNLLRQIAGRMRARNAEVQKSLEQSLRLKHLEKELQFAHDLQVSMLPYRPLFIKHPEVDVDALMEPAKEVGGDFFDAFPLDSNRICVAIGDVSGKGVPAALFMVRSITVLRTEMLKTMDLSQTIHALNKILSEDNDLCMFVTLMIVVVDLNQGLLQYVNGGHSRPLFGNFNEGFRFLEQPSGILVGINPQANYQIAERILAPGDMLILYTDGVTEAVNPELAEFSEHNLLKFVNEQREQSASDMIAGIQHAVQNFASTAEQSDDLTLLALCYRGD